jgi:hypothetical protein
MFIQALAGKAHEASEALVASSPNDLIINQGRAQAYRAVYRTCATAIQKQAELEGKR